ncbi:MAG: serine hydrolase [Chloracidobacterium sp.]|nr:serine hydrolase [Chloracidobacterium sp.]
MNRFLPITLAVIITVCNGFAQRTLSETERYRLAADYSQQNRGVSVLVMKGDKIVFEEYQNGRSADQPWILASGTKSFSGVMAAAAIDDKLIKDLDEKVADTITEWKSDLRKSKITIRQLLSLTSGIDAGQIGRVPSYADATKSSATHEPGTHFEYGPAPFQIFGELMTRKLKPKNESVMAYLKRRILDPIGLSVGFWRSVDGQPLLPQGASLTAREWVKFGQLLKNNGKWNGKQIVSKKILDELSVGSKTNPAYGITFWLNQKGQDPRGRSIGGAVEGIMKNGIAEGVSDLFMAAGAGNQRLYIIRSLDMVIVRQGNFGTWDDTEFMRRMLTGVAK